MVVNKDEVLDHLGRLGLSDYEGKVYLSLLQIHPATAYEAARDAGVPTSKVYEVLDRLEGRGMVRAQDESGRKRYLPQPALDFVEAHRRRLGGTLDRLGRDLIRLEAPRDEASVWNLADEAALLDKACRLVQGAAETLLVSAWHAEAAILAPLIRQAADRGVRTALVQFGPGDLDVPRVFSTPSRAPSTPRRGDGSSPSSPTAARPWSAWYRPAAGA